MSSGSGGGSGGSGSSGSSSSGSKPVTRRQAIAGALTTAAAGATVGGILSSVLDPEDDEDDPRVPESQNFAVYDENQDRNFDHDQRILEQHSDMSGLRSEYESSNAITQVDDVLEGNDDVRIRRDGTATRDVNDTGGELPDDVAEDPEYILGLDLDSTFKRIVDGDGDGSTSEQTFTDFDAAEGVSVDEQSVIDQYGITEEDRAAISEAVGSLDNLGVFASTNIATEQPTARPDALTEAKEKVARELSALETLYHDVKDEADDVANVKDRLAGNIEDAKQDKQAAEQAAYEAGVQDDREYGIQGEDRATDLLGSAREMFGEYTGLTNNIAADIGRLEVVRRTLDSAKDRANEIFENSELSDAYQDVEVNSQTYTGVKLDEVRNWGLIDDQEIGFNNYFQSEADRLDTTADELVVTYDSDSNQAFLVNPENDEYTEADFDNPGQVFRDIQDGVYDGALED
jgi:hypothetical protein